MGYFAAFDPFPEPEAIQLHPLELGGWKSGRKILLEQNATDINRSPISEPTQIQLSAAQDQSILHLPSDLHPTAGEKPTQCSPASLPGSLTFGITFAGSEITQTTLLRYKTPIFATC